MSQVREDLSRPEGVEMLRFQEYMLEGIPIPLARPRLGKNVVYDPQLGLKFATQIQLKKQHGTNGFFLKPVHLEITFYMPMSRTWSAKKHDSLLRTAHVYRPDFSNLLKYVEDCATGILYKDDSIIYSVSGKKIYDEVPRTEFSLQEI